jgi:outer membrane protein
VPSVGATLQLPLYAGGAEWARLRRAKEIRRQRRSALDDVGRATTAAITSAWQERRTAAARIRSLQVQADAAAFALDGVRQEALVGSRTVLDILDAEEELFETETDLIKARREEVLSAYRLQAAMGRLTAEELGLGVEIYDPTAHYRDVRKRWFGNARIGSSP